MSHAARTKKKEISFSRAVVCCADGSNTLYSFLKLCVSEKKEGEEQKQNVHIRIFSTVRRIN